MPETTSVSKKLMPLGKTCASGFWILHSGRDPSLYSQEDMQAFCQGKTVDRIWADMSVCDEGQTIVTFFNDGSVLEMRFVQERHWSDITWDSAEVHWFGYLANELEAVQ